MSKSILKRYSLLAVMMSAIAVAYSNVAIAYPTYPLTTSMMCEEASDLVAAKSAVFLSTGAYTFDRFVDSQAQCQLSERAEPAWVATSDTPSCFIGYTCMQSRR